MRAAAQSTSLALLLGLGAIDLAALNFWVLPSLLLPAVVASRSDTQTAVMAASEHEAVAAAAPVTVAPVTAAPVTAAAAPAEDPRPIQGPGASDVMPEAVAREQAPGALTADRDSHSAVVMFRKGTWWIGPSDRQRLTQLAGTAVGARVTFEIDGYADESGPDMLNQRLSHARADAIAELLVRAGIDRARITMRAHGELPVVRGDGSDERRAELRVLPEEAR